MTREQFALLIHWSFIIWLAGIVNAFAFLPQLARVIRSREVEGLSLATLITIFWIQFAFALQGFFEHDIILLASNACAACMNAILISTVLFFRSRRREGLAR